MTQDPLGLAGGVNLYAYAGDNPVSFWDPFGLCSPYGDDPCNTDTGDVNLDDPHRRHLIEQTYKGAPPTATPRNEGLKDEVWTWASVGQDGTVQAVSTIGTPIRVVPGQQPNGAIFGAHSHPNEGTLVCCDRSGNRAWASSAGPGQGDKEVAQKSSVPTYTVGKDKIWRLDPKTGKVTVFNRWK